MPMAYRVGVRLPRSQRQRLRVTLYPILLLLCLCGLELMLVSTAPTTGAMTLPGVSEGSLDIAISGQMDWCWESRPTSPSPGEPGLTLRTLPPMYSGMVLAEESLALQLATSYLTQPRE